MKQFIHKRIAILAVVVAIVLLSVGILLWRWSADESACRGLSAKDSRCLLSPTARTGDASKLSLAQTRREVHSYIEKNNLQEGFSLYYSDLESGRRITHKDENMMFAASLMKLPIAMDLYAAVEDGTADLNDTMVLTETFYDEGFTSFNASDIGKEFTIDELVRIMLVESDNTALFMVSNYYENHTGFDKRSIVEELDTLFTMTKSGDGILIGAQEYSNMLKCLYHACFLSPEYSSLTLSHLENSSYSGGIKAELPEDVRIAHKYGVFNKEAFNDCGVVYEPRHPFVICFMSSKSAEESVVHIREITKIIYSHIERSED